MTLKTDIEAFLSAAENCPYAPPWGSNYCGEIWTTQESDPDEPFGKTYKAILDTRYGPGEDLAKFVVASRNLAPSIIARLERKVEVLREATSACQKYFSGMNAPSEICSLARVRELDQIAREALGETDLTKERDSLVEAAQQVVTARAKMEDPAGAIHRLALVLEALDVARG